MGSFTPSKYQVTIRDWVVEGRGNAVIEATAGSGKSSSLIWVSEYIKGSTLFCAFSKHIVEELKGRLPKNVDIKTMHSIGRSALVKVLGNNLKINSNKYYNLCLDLAFDFHANAEEEVKYIKAVELTSILKQLISLAQANLINSQNTNALDDLANHYGADTKSYSTFELGKMIEIVQEKSMTLAKYSKEIDFMDMTWLPIAWNLDFDQYDWLMVDEAQDLNKCQLEIVLRSRRSAGRVIAVGDRNQAIYGFTGSDCDSFLNIAKVLDAKLLPLSICYRCPSSHIKLAKTIVPSIECRDGASEGVIEVVTKNKLIDEIQEGDYVISRCTAPLVSLCLELISNKIPAVIKGKDIAGGLIKVVEEVASLRRFKYKDFAYCLEVYEEQQLEKLGKRKNAEVLMEKVKDTCAAVLACYQGYNCKTVKKLCSEIQDLFSEERGSITLCTVHKAKGLEGDRVYIIDSDRMPLTWSRQKDWQYDQELNLKYVAFTRAKKYLAFVKNNDRSKLNIEGDLDLLFGKSVEPVLVTA